MLTFMNSKLRWMVKTSKTIFSKKVNPMKYLVQMHPIIQVWCIPLDHKIYTKCKKTSNLIKDISSHNICSGIKSQQVKKDICYSVPKTFWFFSEFPCSILSSNFRPFNFMGAFSRLTKWKLPKLKKKLKEIPYPPQKKLLKRKGKSITPAKTNIPISKTSSEC